jgi:hypothetical protein
VLAEPVAVAKRDANTKGRQTIRNGETQAAIQIDRCVDVNSVDEIIIHNALLTTKITQEYVKLFGLPMS